jgi:hypothetical protein
MESDWTQIGEIGVDAGICWIGDPCYIHPDGGENKPRGFGKNWEDFCDILGKLTNEHTESSCQFGKLGVCVSTGYGDGRYPVFVKYNDGNEKGRIAEVKVVFIEEDDHDNDFEEEEN